MTYTALFALLFLACLGCALSMRRQQALVIGSGVPPKLSSAYRTGGFALMFTGLALAMYAFGIGRGIVVFCGMATVASVVIALLFSLTPKLFQLFFPH